MNSNENVYENPKKSDTMSENHTRINTTISNKDNQQLKIILIQYLNQQNDSFIEVFFNTFEYDLIGNEKNEHEHEHVSKFHFKNTNIQFIKPLLDKFVSLLSKLTHSHEILNIKVKDDFHELNENVMNCFTNSSINPSNHDNTKKISSLQDILNKCLYWISILQPKSYSKNTNMIHEHITYLSCSVDNCLNNEESHIHIYHYLVNFVLILKVLYFHIYDMTLVV